MTASASASAAAAAAQSPIGSATAAAAGPRSASGAAKAPGKKDLLARNIIQGDLNILHGAIAKGSGDGIKSALEAVVVSSQGKATTIEKELEELRTVLADCTTSDAREKLGNDGIPVINKAAYGIYENNVITKESIIAAKFGPNDDVERLARFIVEMGLPSELEEDRKQFITKHFVMGCEEVARMIKTDKKHLILAGYRIYMLPVGIEHLATQLEKLDLESSTLPALPKEIGEFKALKLLDLYNTPIKHLPDEIEGLTALTGLQIAASHLTIVKKVALAFVLCYSKIKKAYVHKPLQSRFTSKSYHIPVVRKESKICYAGL